MIAPNCDLGLSDLPVLVKPSSSDSSNVKNLKPTETDHGVEATEFENCADELELNIGLEQGASDLVDSPNDLVDSPDQDLLVD
ncbi:hypothetical protein ACFX2A_038214 [Malus domestica]